MTTEKRGKGRQLSAEEKALWQGVAATVEPLRMRKRRRSTTAQPESQDDEPAATPTTDALKNAKSPASAATTAGKAKPVAPFASALGKPKATKKPPLVDFEARAARKLAAGKLDIDARIDLHGMRQEEARNALRRFLVVAQQRGHRHVKVITGKGRPTDDSAHFDLFDDRRGVLRQSVPEWLAAPDLRDIVVSYTTAGRSHGGDGALYVRIRRPR